MKNFLFKTPFAMFIHKKILLTVFLSAGFMTCLSGFVLASGFAYTGAQGPRIRVAIAKDLTSAKVIYNKKNVSFEVRNEKLFRNGQETDHKKESFESKRQIGIKIGREIKYYRGQVEVMLSDHGKILLINRVNLEDYIRGVLYHEVTHRWPMEAMKAQAVAARTYALFKMEENQDSPYDLTSDIYSQMYGGKSAERYRTNLAVRATLGKILVYQGRILPAFYHSTCAGQTEDVLALWNYPGFKPLRGVKCPFCHGSPHSSWKKNMRLGDIQHALNKNGQKIGLIKEIRVVEKTLSGRVKTLEIISRDGKMINVSGKVFRNLLGPNNLKSNFFDVIMRGYYCDFIGKGWGHGVGMCQWGAREMARKRFSYEEILAFYYPGSEIINYYDLDLLNKR